MSDQQRARRDIERRRQNAKKLPLKETLPFGDVPPRKPTSVYGRELQITWQGGQPQETWRVEYSESVDRTHAMSAYKKKFRQMLNENTFRFENCVFRYGDTIESFAEVNGLTPAKAHAVFIKAQAVAIERREMALKRLERSRISINRRHLGKGDYEHEYHLLSFEWTNLLPLDQADLTQMFPSVLIKRYRTQ